MLLLPEPLLYVEPLLEPDDVLLFEPLVVVPLLLPEFVLLFEPLVVDEPLLLVVLVLLVDEELLLWSDIDELVMPPDVID